jgi:Caspase domain/Domain of unknown function (DUF4384)
MGLARRQFLEMVSASLLGWQVMSYSQIAQAADLYGNNLSQPTKRKLALLIGINQYDAKGDWLPLNGCVTDVELQQELLVHRFGFKPADIVTLTDRAATKAAIAQAFTEHLIAQALPGDVVVIHFSGHGSRVGQNNTLIPADGGMPGAGLVVNDLMDDTMMLWLQAIATERTICILDAGHYYPGKPVVGNFRIRTRPSQRDWQLSPEELDLQQSLKAQIGNRQGLGQEAKSSNKVTAPGIVLRATSNDLLCADAQWPGFSSGVFTYALTQQLWQVTPATSLHVVLGNVNSTLAQKAFQSDLTPAKQLTAHIGGSEVKQKTLASYAQNFDDLFPASSAATKGNLDGAEGVIMSVSSDRRAGEIWLAGLPIAPLGNYGVGSILAAVDPDSPSDLQSSALVQVRSHYGLTAKVESLPGQSGLQVGQLLQEQVRTLPRNLTLTIALDLELSKIERVDATSAISAMPGMLGVNAAEEFADCLFGAQSTSYGLFSVGRSPILGSFGSVGESVGAALRRLQPLLEGLLAAKLIRLTNNQASSTLGLRVTLSAMTAANSKSVVISSKTTQRTDASTNKAIEALRSPNILNKSLTIGDRLICRLENFTDLPLYVRIFSLDPRGKIMTPHFFTSPYALDSIVPAKQELLIPQIEAPFDWVVSAPQGLFDIQLVVSRDPLTETTKLLEQSSRQAASPTGMVVVPNPLQVAQALLSDLHNPERGMTSSTKTEDMWMLDVKDWATLGFTYRVS